MILFSSEARRIRRALILLSFLVGACESAVEPDPVLRLELVSGGDQVGGAATTLTLPVTVAVRDDAGRPVADADVRWHVAQGGGAVDVALVRTDSAGTASVRWTLGREIGMQLIVAEGQGSSLSVRATAEFRVTRIAAGYRHSCALSSAGDVYCWGSNANGQLGDGSGVSRARPTPIPSGVAFRDVWAGWFHTCAASVLEEMVCWGDNSQGQLASLLRGIHHSPAKVDEMGLLALSGGYLHTCTIGDEGKLGCWGSDEFAQLATMNGMVAVASGEFHTCGIRQDGAALCWGLNTLGEVGGSVERGVVARVPVVVSDTLRFRAITAASRHTCAIALEGAAFCWGRSSAGEIGRVPLDHTAIPSRVTGIEGFTSIATGDRHTCGLSGGRAYCWGRWLGNGSAESSPVPVLVDGLSEVTHVSAGFDHTCAVALGQVWCWGSNSHGQLGREGIAESLIPIRVTFR